MNNIDKTYTDLLQDILDNGVTKQTRNGGTISVFGRQIRHKMSDGFPLLTTKKMHWRSIVTELMWFLQGRTDLRWLLEQGNTIWVGDAYKNWCKQFEVDPNNFDGEEIAKGHNDQCWGYPILDHVKPTSKEYKRGQINAYLEGKAEKPFFYLTQEEFINKIKTDNEFANKWGDLGPVYGKQWRSWGSNIIDELGNVYTNEVDYDIQNGKLPNGSSNRKFVIDELKKYNPRIDQIANLINDLKTNPDSRRLMVSAWNVGELDQCVLPPCHYGFQVYTRELSSQERMDVYNKSNWNKDIFPSDVSGWNRLLDTYNIPTRAISLMWNQRSVDTFLGLPFNIASYGLLLEIIAKEVNMIPDELIGNLGDVHLYSNHIEQAKEQIGRELTIEERTSLFRKQQNLSDDVDFVGTDRDAHSVFDDYGITKRTREPYPLPTLNINTEFWKTESGECGVGPLNTNLQGFEIADFQLANYQSHPSIKAPLSN